MPPKADKHTRGIILDHASQPTPAVGTSWFLGIGINRYLHFPDLNNAVKDVQDLVALLQKQYDLQPDHTLTLFDEQATRDHIIDHLDELVENVGPADKLLLYFSGHGYVHARSQLAYWIPHDAKSGRISGYLPNSTIRDYLKAIQSMHTLLISDSCFSGSLFVRGPSRSESAMDDLERRRSRWGLVSGRQDEQVYDGDPGTNSPFAGSILKVLKQNQRAKLNIARLADEVVEMTRSNYQQLPEGNPLFGVGHDGGQYVFRLVGSESNLWERCLAEDSLATYNAYLDHFPQGAHADQALQRIRKLEEEQAWQKTLRQHRIYAYRTFLRSFPQGHYAETAREHIRELQRAAHEETEGKQQQQQFQPQLQSQLQPQDVPASQAAEQQQNAPLPNKVVAAPAMPTTISPTSWPPYLLYPALAILLVLLIWGLPRLLDDTGTDTDTLLPYEDTSQEYGYGYRNRDGEVVIPPSFDYAYPFSEGRAVVEKDNFLGVIDEKGRLIADFHYESIEAYSQGRAMVMLQGKYGFIDAAGEVVIPIQYDNAGSFGENRQAYVELNGRGMEIDLDGRCIRNCPGDNTIIQPGDRQGSTVDWDQNTWEEIRSTNEVQNFQQYLRTFPEGKYKSEAITRIQQLNEENEWANIQGEHSAAAYLRYLNKYPNGKYAAEAQLRINELNAGDLNIAYPLSGRHPLGGRSYRTIQLAADAPIWMVENMAYPIPEQSWCYQNDPSRCRQYGRLYTREAAQRACEAFGGRLPTQDDWVALLERLSSNVSDEFAAPKLTEGELQLSFTGYRSLEGNFLDQGHTGLYWLQELPEQPQSGYAWQLLSNGADLNQVSMDVREGLACRCVK